MAVDEMFSFFLLEGDDVNQALSRCLATQQQTSVRDIFNLFD